MSLDVREEDLPPVVAADAPLAGKTVVITGTISDPRSGEKSPRPTFQRLCEKAGRDNGVVGLGEHRLADHRRRRRRAKLTKAEKLEVEVVDQDEIWQQLIAAGVV